jgi:hypothetical protein
MISLDTLARCLIAPKKALPETGLVPVRQKILWELVGKAQAPKLEGTYYTPGRQLCNHSIDIDAPGKGFGVSWSWVFLGKRPCDLIREGTRFKVTIEEVE